MVQAQVGIGITTHNREVIGIVIQNIIRHTPHAKIVVVDDCSDIDVVAILMGARLLGKVKYFKFLQNVGIAKAKNKCLELLQDCEHIFLFDDDCFPVKLGWEKDYIKANKETGNNHFCFTFPKLRNGQSNGNDLIGKHKGLNRYSKACGVMMYVHNSVLKKVGGMDTNYLRYGCEHLGYSHRIYNAGLNDYPFLDVPNSMDLFYSYDYEQAIKNSIGTGKQAYVQHNRALYELEKKQSCFKAYK